MNLISLKNKKALVGARPIPKGSLPHQLSSDPFLDWVLILSLGIVVVLILVGVGISVYLGDKEALTTIERLPGKAALSFDRASMDEVIEDFDRLSERKKAILDDYTAPHDPLLP